MVDTFQFESDFKKCWLPWRERENLGTLRKIQRRKPASRPQMTSLPVLEPRMSRTRAPVVTRIVGGKLMLSPLTMHYNIPLPPGPDLNSCMFSSLCFSFNRLKRILLINSNCAAGLAACLGNMTQMFGDWMADPVKKPWVLSRFNHSIIPRVYSLHIIDDVKI